MEHATTKVDSTYKIDDPPDSVPYVPFQDNSPSTQAPEKLFPSSQECVRYTLARWLS
jgi:hypothetical protein